MTKQWKADKDADWVQTWERMQELYEKHPEKLRAIGDWQLFLSLRRVSDSEDSGVSNVSIEYLERLLKVAKVIPAVNQVELHPWVTSFIVTRSSYFANSELVSGPTLKPTSLIHVRNMGLLLPHIPHLGLRIPLFLDMR